MGRCEVYDRENCTGCESLNPEYDIERNKKRCETYQEEMQWEKGEQEKWFQKYQ